MNPSCVDFPSVLAVVVAGWGSKEVYFERSFSLEILWCLDCADAVHSVGSQIRRQGIDRLRRSLYLVASFGTSD